jgi:hypothetical protein
MKKFLLLVGFGLIGSTVFAQINFGYLQTDSLLRELSKAKHDTGRVLLMANISESYRWSNPDSAMYFGQKALDLARKINFPRGEASALISTSVVNRELGNLAKALDLATQALLITQQHHFHGEEISALIRIGNVYASSKDFNKALGYFHQAEIKSAGIGNSLYVNISQWLIASAFEQINKLDSAEYYSEEAQRNLPFDMGAAFAYNILGDVQIKLKKDSAALLNYWIGLKEAARLKDYRTAANLNISLANYYKKHNQDSAIYYAKEALAVAQFLSYKNRIISSSGILAEIYESRDPREALKYYKLFNAAKDSLYGAEKMQALQALLMNEQEQQKEAEAAKLAYQNRVRQYALLIGLALVSIIVLLLYRNNRRKQKANEILKKQKKEIDEQKKQSDIEASLERVRTIALSMKEPPDMLEVCKTISHQLELLGVREIRNVQTAIFYENKGTYMNYEYYAKHDKAIVTETSYTNHKIHQAFANQMLKGNGQTFITQIKDEEVKDWMAYQKTTNVFIDDYLYTASSLNYYWYSLGPVALGISTYDALTGEGRKLFNRFVKVFELAYRRYLDIEQAEAQAKEARIETALERVRSRSMAMHKSDELLEVITVVSEQLQKLNIKFGFVSFGFTGPNLDYDFWLASPGFALPERIHAPYIDNPIPNTVIEARRKGLIFFTSVFSREDNNQWLQVLFEHNKTSRLFEKTKDLLLGSPGFARSAVLLKNINIFIGNYIPKPYSDEENEIIKRFANVFEQSYTRFLDLQKAEAQTREATIEAALERVRSRTMAMHQSKEITDIAGKIFEELRQLDLVLNRVLIWIFNDEERYINWWSANPEAESNAESYKIDYNDQPVFLSYLHAWQKRTPLHRYTLSGDTKKQWEDHLFTNTELSKLPIAVRKGMREEGTIFTTSTISDYGLMMVGSFELLSDENVDIIQRFGRVFQQSYTRYLDVLKAEAQAREAKIEAAMEKVRARAMAMQKPNELIEVAQLLRKEMGLLGVEELETSSIYIHHEDSGTTECWYAIQDQREKKLVSDHMTIVLSDTAVGREMLEFYHSDKKQVSIVMQGESRKEWINYCANHSKAVLGFYGDNIPDRTYHLYKFSGGYMGAASSGDISEESWELLKRATAVFSLAYTRFSDLQLAEAQAREATIEAALERVRGKAMAMHNSNDLSSAASLVFTELRKLGINPIRCGVGLLNKESRKAQLYSATSSNNTDTLSLVGWVQLSGHPVLENIYDTWLTNKEYYPELTGEQLKSYYELLLTGLSVTVPDWESGQKQYGHFLPFSVGCLYAWSDNPYSDAEIKILKRFASIIDLTFRRYLDLQKAEASAKEVVKQAALDRIRADIASMRTVGDLDKITPLIWNELTVLGLPFIRCGVFIMDESQQLIHTFLSTPDGKAIGAFHLPYATGGNIPRVLEHWHKKSIYTDHWDEGAFTDFANELVKQNALSSTEQYLATVPKGGFYLHFLPFLQGMLYVGSLEMMK